MRRRKEIEDPNNTWDMQLMAAVLRKDTDEAAKLLEKGAKINHAAADASGKLVTPFLAAALKADFGTAAWIAANGGDPHAQFENGATILHHCVQTDNADLLEQLCAHRASISEAFSVSARDRQGMTPTELAIHLAKPELARILIKHGAKHPFHALIDATHCQTARACRTGDLQLLETLLQCGDNPHQRDANGQSLMHIAVQQPAVLDLLIDRGLSINTLNAQQQTPLLYVVLNMPRNVDVLESLLQRGADPNIGDGLGVTPLMHAVSALSAESIRKLLEAKVDVNARDAFGASVVHYAVVARRKTALELLLSVEGIDVNAVDLRGETPLHRAALAGRCDTLSVLIAREQVDANIADRDGNTALHAAVVANQTASVQLLLQRANDEFLAAQNPAANPKDKKPAPKKGAKDVAEAPTTAKLAVDAVNRAGLTALQIASSLKRYDCVRPLIDAGADVHRSSQHGTLLHEFVVNGDLGMTELMLSKGAGVNVRNDKDISPLHMAVEHGLLDVAALLIRFGAVIAEQDAFQLRSPLHAACAISHFELVKLLLEKGPPSIVRCTDANVRTPLHIACRNNDVRTAALLIEADAATDAHGGLAGVTSTLDAADESGDTAAHYAAEVDGVECLQLLVDSGASFVSTNLKNWSPLHTAVAFKSERVVVMLLSLLRTALGPARLLEALATQDTSRRFPLLLAAEFGSPSIAKLLIKAKGDAERDLLLSRQQHEAASAAVRPAASGVAAVPPLEVELL